MGLFSSPPPTVNSRGDTLNSRDALGLAGVGKTSSFGGWFGSLGNEDLANLSPQKRGEMLYNWLTAGGPPKPIEAGKIFKDKQDFAGVEAKASAGQGISGLFGIGKMIGELSPNLPTLPDAGGVKTIEMIKPMNESPMQPGVPYSARPVGGK